MECVNAAVERKILEHTRYFLSRSRTLSSFSTSFQPQTGSFYFSLEKEKSQHELPRWGLLTGGESVSQKHGKCLLTNLCRHGIFLSGRAPCVVCSGTSWKAFLLNWREKESDPLRYTRTCSQSPTLKNFCSNTGYRLAILYPTNLWTKPS